MSERVQPAPKVGSQISVVAARRLELRTYGL